MPDDRADMDMRQRIEAKRQAGCFDVFLCHNSVDKPRVKEIGTRLMEEYGLLPWLDEWDLRPGLPWQRELEARIKTISCAAVFLGPSGTGPWQDEELAAFLQAFVRTNRPLIPVILPDGGSPPEVPLFLQGRTWVDFRLPDPDPMTQLVYGITGARESHPAFRAAELGRAQPVVPSSTARLSPVRANTPPLSPEAARLVATISDRLASTQDRIAAGRRLAEIGDPRPGVGLRSDGLPDIAWCDVPAGAFFYGSDDQYPDEKPRRTVRLDAFRIAKYSLTYCQFQAFIDASDGYADPRWWDGLHEKSRRRGGPGEQLFKFDNHPRDSVSWYDAMAFCRWLSVKVGEAVTLPTELQWEKAARSTDGRTYPYGNEFDGTKGNTDKTGIHQTSAVGAFPDGASPYGVMDMSGNVWEWTLTEYESKSDTNVSSSARRVVRGGAWGSGPDLARAGCRSVSPPSGRSNGIGFRLAASPAKIP